MATAKMMVYPYLSIGSDGTLGRVFSQSYQGTDSISETSGQIYIHLPAMEIEVQIPDDVRPACVALLRHTKEQKTAEHVKLMTQFQFMENQLLGLAAPEVLDAAPKAARHNPMTASYCRHCGMLEENHEGQTHAFELDDDIPF